MTRIAIIGNAGGGKSTVGRWLRDVLGLPLHSIDTLQWRAGWKPAPQEEVYAAHRQILIEPRWIIDGWGDFDMIEARFREADTVVLVDYPLGRHYWWAVKRQLACIFHERPDGPPGCPMLPKTWALLKMIWIIDRSLMPRLRKLAEECKGRANVYHIRTLEELNEFYRTAKLAAARV